MSAYLVARGIRAARAFGGRLQRVSSARALGLVRELAGPGRVRLVLHPEASIVGAAGMVLVGGLLYFALPQEPALLMGLVPTVSAFAFARSLRGGMLARFFLCLGLLGAGFTFATARMQYDATALLARGWTADLRSAHVTSVEHRADNSRRYHLEILDAGSRMPLPAGAIVRVTDRTRADPIEVGSLVRGRVRLMPHRPPLTAGGYDFRLAAFAEGISASGYSLGSLQVMNTPRSDGLAGAVRAYRSGFAARLKDAVGGQEGALAAALSVGDRAGLSPETREALRAAGLAHLLAISGLHMGLVIAAVLFSVETLIALWPALALRLNPRKCAAVVALAAAITYLVISGAAVSTQRAFAMGAVVLVATLLDRPVLSMRSVAIAALVVFALSPAAIVGPGFQMSFAATTALVLAFERIGLTARSADPSSGEIYTLTDRAAAALRASLIVTLLTQLAVGPAALFHFQTLSVVAFVANLIAVPVIAFLVMPLLVVSTLIDAVGIGWPVAVLAAPFLGAILDLAAALADWPGAVIRVSAPHPMAFAAAMLVMGLGAVLRIHRSSPVYLPIGAASSAAPGNPVRRQIVWIAAVGGLALVPVLLWRAEAPVAYLSGRTPGIAAFDQNRVALFGLRSTGFQMDVWRAAWGVDSNAPVERLTRRCSNDDTLCTVTLPGGQTLATATTRSAWHSACATAHLLVADRRLNRAAGRTYRIGDSGKPGRCKARVIARERILFDGPVAIYSTDMAARPRAEAMAHWPSRIWHPGWTGFQRSNGR